MKRPASANCCHCGFSRPGVHGAGASTNACFARMSTSLADNRVVTNWSYWSDGTLVTWTVMLGYCFSNAALILAMAETAGGLFHWIGLSVMGAWAARAAGAALPAAI